MKKRRILLNVLILLVVIFFAYHAFSYVRLRRDGDASEALYRSAAKSFSKEEDPWDDMKSKFPHAVGWIRSSDGKVDYPVVRGEDNETYLRRAADGEENVFGSIFMDYRNTGFADPFVMVYGHMTKDGSMFGSLNAFKAGGDVPSFEYSEREGHYWGEPVLAAVIDGETLIDPRDYGDFNKRAEFYHKLKQDAVFDTGYELKKEDHLVILVTCSYERHNVRLVVVTVSGK